MWVKNNFKSLASKDGISNIVSIMKSYFLKWYDSLTSPAAPKAAASQLQHSFSLAPATIILSSLNLNISDNDSTLTQLSFAVFILSLVALLCLINIVAYIVGYYLVNNNKYEVKYPKLSRFITFYKKSTLFFLGLEILLCAICLLILVVFSLLYVYAGINNR